MADFTTGRNNSEETVCPFVGILSCPATNSGNNFRVHSPASYLWPPFGSVTKLLVMRTIGSDTHICAVATWQWHQEGYTAHRALSLLVGV